MKAREVILLALIVTAVWNTALAQVRPPQRVMRTYIPPEELVSFPPNTPMNQFIQMINPMVQSRLGKLVVDPAGRTDPIGVPITAAHFLDALETVLAVHGLALRETDQFFIVVSAQEEEAGQKVFSTAKDTDEELPEEFSPENREIEISAVLFNLNLSISRDIGINWDALFGQNASGATGSGGTGSGETGGGQGGGTNVFTLRTGEMLDGLDRYYITPPGELTFQQLTDFFRLLENEGLGEVIASPQILVQSGQQGRIQIGTDVPIQTRDFAGNTITQFVQTGVIINVTPTYIEMVLDSAKTDTLRYIHLNVQVENSSATPSTAGPIVDRNVAQTKLLLLNGEQVVIGGLYSTRESVSRKGIPLLKDLPWWFFGLRYVFGRTQRTISRSELLIALHVRVLPRLEERRATVSPTSLLEDVRARVLSRIIRVHPQLRNRIIYRK